MELLIAVINEEDRLDDVLSGLLEIGITGATVIDSEGMGHVLSRDIPVFTGLRTLISRARPRNQTIFSVVESEEKVESALALLEEIFGDRAGPATGIAFTVPVSRVLGLAPELGAGDL